MHQGNIERPAIHPWRYHILAISLALACCHEDSRARHANLCLENLHNQCMNTTNLVRASIAIDGAPNWALTIPCGTDALDLIILEKSCTPMASPLSYGWWFHGLSEIHDLTGFVVWSVNYTPSHKNWRSRLIQANPYHLRRTYAIFVI